MNLIEYYKEKGLSIEGERQINMIVGCIVASDLNNRDKRELIDFMRAIEDYITGDIFDDEDCSCTDMDCENCRQYWGEDSI